MFKFLKDKLRKAVDTFSKTVEEEAEDAVVTEEDVEEQKKAPKKKARPKKKPKKKEVEEPVEEESVKEERPKKERKPIPKKKKKAKPKTLEDKDEAAKENVELLDEVIEKLDEDIDKVEEAEDEGWDDDKEESGQEVEIIGVEEPEKKKGFFGKIFGKKKEEVEEEPKTEEEPEEEKEEEPEEDVEKTAEEEPKKGFFGKLKEGVVAKKLSESKFQDLFFELEVALLENNVAVEVIEKIKEDLKEELVDKKLNRFEIEKIIFSTLQESLEEVLDHEPLDILKLAKDKKPLVIVFVGVNGSGKTTTIGKVAKYLENNNLKSVLVAADTFRAAAIQQLEEHANNLNMKMIKHDYGSDPAAVAFDGVKYAESKGLDVVLIDTAGRLHSNTNLMEELKKIIRVAKPDLKIFIGESITGNDCIEQAQKFNETIQIDGIILSKADVDEKGGAAISVSYVTDKPILFIGNGQEYDDLQPFDKDIILKNLGLE